MRRKLHEIEVLILNHEYKAFVIYGNKKKALEYINEYFEENYSMDAVQGFRGRCFMQDGCHPVIFLDIDRLEADYKKHIFATLAHEAVHAVDNIFRTIGEEHSNEVFAHSVGAIVGEFERNYR